MSVYDHRCADCQVCPACDRSAWCESDRILVIPCEHHGYCGDCAPTECPECQADVEAEILRDIDEDLAATFERFDGDPFRQPGDDTDPLTELAAESRRVTDRFWGGVGDRSHLRPTDERGLA